MIYANKNIKSNNKIVKNDKGNWEFSFFQRKYDPNEESNIKLKMKSLNDFDPKLVHQYINPTLSKEELLLIKQKNVKKLNSNELIIINNYLSKRIKDVIQDFSNIKLLGLYAKPITKEGKGKLLLLSLDNQIKNKNDDLLLNIYFKLLDTNILITPELQTEYVIQLEYMNNIIKNCNLIELQFTKLYSQMPPLNIKGFKKFDSWQIDVINNIDNNVSTLINAPTSAGKSVLSGYTTTKGKVLFVVPTDALAWQMSTYVGNILGTNVPIITSTYQSCPMRNQFIEILNKSSAISGTADAIIDFLPFIKNDFKWIVFDEIHMIGNVEGSSMEYIIKILNNVPFLALSATINNTDELAEWFQKITNKNVSKIICSKRFFNLQRHYYNNTEDKLTLIHPFALIDEIQIKTKCITSSSLQATAPDIWDLAMKLKAKFDMKHLCPYVYFKRTIIELDDANEYFDEILNYVYDKYETDKDLILEILNTYKLNSIIDTEINLVKLTFKLKEEKNTPSILFNNNTIKCLKMVKEYAKQLEELETETYPTLYSERIKQEKVNKKLEKKINDSDKNTNDKDKKALKKMLDVDTSKNDKAGKNTNKYNQDNNNSIIKSSKVIKNENIVINHVSIQEPHPNFILNNNQFFSENLIFDWSEKLKQYFAVNGSEYHFIIKLLWRGVGVYVEGLPDPYLRLVQSLACQKQLSIVFSDKSLIYGISMPFRSVVIINNNDYLSPMIFQQMSGRAGRRGLDKEGNIIFCGFSWNKIKELSVSPPPIILGVYSTIYTVPHANKISNLYNTVQNWNNIFDNYLNKDIDVINNNIILNDINNNYEDKWKFAFNEDNINHLHMNWKLRYSNECIIISYILPYIARAFEDKDHTQEINQINIFHFLCCFISIKETTDQSLLLIKPSIMSHYPYNTINIELENIGINIPNNINKQLFIIVQNNKLIINDSYDNRREDLIIFGNKIKIIQHYCFHAKIHGLSRLLGKLLTRIWWIYHSSSPVSKSFNDFNI